MSVLNFSQSQGKTREEAEAKFLEVEVTAEEKKDLQEVILY